MAKLSLAVASSRILSNRSSRIGLLFILWVSAGSIVVYYGAVQYLQPGGGYRSDFARSPVYSPASSMRQAVTTRQTLNSYTQVGYDSFPTAAAASSSSKSKGAPFDIIKGVIGFGIGACCAVIVTGIAAIAISVSRVNFEAMIPQTSPVNPMPMNQPIPNFGSAVEQENSVEPALDQIPTPPKQTQVRLPIVSAASSAAVTGRSKWQNSLRTDPGQPPVKTGHRERPAFNIDVRNIQGF